MEGQRREEGGECGREEEEGRGGRGGGRSDKRGEERGKGKGETLIEDS